MTVENVFTLEVQPKAGDAYVIRAEFQGAVWHAALDAILPLLTPAEKAESMRWIERDLLEHSAARDLGTRLFYSLFPSAIRNGLRSAIATATQSQPIRLLLQIPPDLAALPWELLYNPDEGEGFLARSSVISLARWTPGNVRPHTTPTALPVRVLVVVASPTGMPPLGSEDELSSLRAILTRRTPNLPETALMVAQELWRRRGLTDLATRLRNRTFIEIDLLLHATRRNLQNVFIDARASGRPIHVVHFIGHSDADEESGATVVLEDEAGAADFVSADDFAEMVSEPSVVLVFLNACRSAMPLRGYQSVAGALLARGVNAVLAMQTDVLDRAAIVLAQEFYGAWAAGLPLEQALAYARRLMTGVYQRTGAGWTIPVLSLRSVAGASITVEGPAVRWPDPLRRLYRAGALIVAALSVLLVLVNSVSLGGDLIRQWLAPAYPPMTGIFNVAVVDPAVIEGQVSQEVEDAATLLADEIFKQLNDFVEATEDLKSFTQVERVKMDVVVVENQEDYAAKIAGVAEQLNADVVIYGTLNIVDLQYTPSFYVSPSLTGAEESTGVQALGGPIDVPLLLSNNTDDRLALMEDFYPRAGAYSRLVLALGLFKVGNYAGSLGYLTALQAVPTWQDDQGKQILYLWMGTNHYHRQWRGLSPESVDCHVPESLATNDLDCALDAYTYADTLYQKTHPGERYARAAIGLGNYWLARDWLVRGEQRILRCEAYAIAAEEYATARAAATAAHPLAFANLKAEYSIGTAFATGFRNGCTPQEQYYLAAVNAFTTTLAIYDDGLHTPVAQDTAARASYQLGVLHHLSAYPELAVEAFERVLAICRDAAEPGDWQSIGWKARVQLGHIYAEYAREGDLPWWRSWGSLTAHWRRSLGYYDSVINAFRAGQFGSNVSRDLENDRVFVADAYAGKAAVLNLRQDYAAAVTAAEDAIRQIDRISPQTRATLKRLPWIAYIEQGRAYAGQQEWEDALAAYGKIIDAADADVPYAFRAEAHLAVGQIQVKRLNRVEAAQHYNAVIALTSPDDPLHVSAQDYLRLLNGD